jgi:arylsulfatase A-like enzyme
MASSTDRNHTGHGELKLQTNAGNPFLSRRDFLKLAGMLSLAPLLNGLPDIRAPQPAGGLVPPNVIFLLFDAMSAANLSLYGYRRPTTPNFERLAGRATVYHNHHSAGNFTSPSTASLFTGVYPWTHRAFHLGGLVTRSLYPHNMFSLLGQAYHQMAYTQNPFSDVLLSQFEPQLQQHLAMDRFSSAGYSIYSHLFPRDGVYGQKSYDQFLFKREESHGSLFFSILNDLIMDYQGRAMEKELRETFPLGLPRSADTSINFSIRDVIHGLQGMLSGLPAPFFAYLHLMPPHAPYRPEREYYNRFKDGWKPLPKKVHHLAAGTAERKTNRQRQLYDEFIANLDDEFGRLFDALDSSGMLDNSYLIVTSDHGEMFERGEVGHSTLMLFEPVIHVPLMILAPGQRERRDIYDLTSNIDLLPTLLQIAGLPIPEWCEGRLLPGMGGQADTQRSIYTIDAKQNLANSPLRKASIALIRGPYKLVRYMGYPSSDDNYEFYDLQSDPEEMADQYTTHPVARELQVEMEQGLAKADAPYLRAS